MPRNAFRISVKAQRRKEFKIGFRNDRLIDSNTHNNNNNNLTF